MKTAFRIWILRFRLWLRASRRPGVEPCEGYGTLDPVNYDRQRGGAVMRFKRALPVRDDWNYQQLWRIVDGAVADCFAVHPGYLSGKRSERTVRASICKRVTGSVLGYVEQSARGRSVEETAAEEVDGTDTPSASAGSTFGPRVWRRMGATARRLWRGRSCKAAPL